jgi:hypothetical protein
MAQQRRFDPYSENGGTILAIAGEDFSVIAGDTRQSEGYNIQTRYAPKVFRLSVVFSPLSHSPIVLRVLAASPGKAPLDSTTRGLG